MSLTNPIPRGTREVTVTTAPGQTAFGPLDFLLYAAADLSLSAKAPGEDYFSQLDPDDFTVTPAAPATTWPAFPRVTLAVARTAGSTLVIRGVRVPSRSTDVTRNGVLQSQALERELDKQVSTEQELRRDIDRASNNVDQIESIAAHVDQVGAQASADAARAEAAANTATDLLSGVISASVSTVVAADALVVAAAPSDIKTSYFDVDRQFGSGVDFVHSGTVNPASPGQIDITAAGVTHFYTRSNLVLRPSQHGVKHGGNPTTNRLGIIEMLNLATQTGREIDWGRYGLIYEIDDTITHEFLTSSVMRGDGPTVKLVSGARKLFALRFIMNNKRVDHEGFSADANELAPNALWYENYATAFSADNQPIRLVGVGGLKGRRALISDYFGAGICVRGPWTQLDADDCFNDYMVAAVGANDASNGIMGFYAGRDSNGLYPIDKNIRNYKHGPIYSEDPAMAFNMDGIHIADIFPSNNGDRVKASTFISGGTFNNPWGRAIKVQGQNVEIQGPQVNISDGPLVGGVKRSTCAVSLQYAEGTVRGLRLFCNAASTISVVDGTARSYANGKMIVDGTQISGRGVIPDIDQIGLRLSDAGAPRGSLQVNGSGASGAFVKRFARIYSRLAGLDQLVMRDNWAEAVTSCGASVEGVGSNTINVLAQGNSQASTARPLVSTVSATAATVGSSADNPGFT